MPDLNAIAICESCCDRVYRILSRDLILVQLLWVNYVWPEVFGFPQTVTGAGVIALALQSSGYLAETFRSGFEGVAEGQRELRWPSG